MIKTLLGKAVLKPAGCGILLALSFSQAFAQSFVPFTAHYEAYRHDSKIGKVDMSLQRLDNGDFRLEYASKVSKFFLSDKRYESSVFSLQNDTIIPKTYAYKRNGTGPNKHLNIEFSNDKIVIDNNRTLPWLGESDNQIFRIDVGRQLALGKTQFTYDYVNSRGDKRQHDIHVLSNESLQLPYGELMATKVVLKRENSSRTTYAWFAPSLNHVLVRLQQFKDGKEQGDIRLQSYLSADTPPKT